MSKQEMEGRQLYKLTTKQKPRQDPQGMAKRPSTRTGLWGIHGSDRKVEVYILILNLSRNYVDKVLIF